MNHMKSSYYVTCLMSGMVELGTIFWGLRYQYSVVFILGLALAYQLGNILRFFVTRNLAKAQDLIACFTVVISVFLLFADKDAPLTYVLTSILFILFSIVLQNVRSSAQGSIPRWQKRSCRVLGFVLAAFMFWAGPVLMVLITCLLLVYSVNLNKYYYDRWFANWIAGRYGRRICWVMVVHQAHYFAYNYVMLIMVMYYYQNPFIAVLWFAANWIPYTITEPLVKKLKWNKWYAISIAAHLFNSAVLIAMFFNVEQVIQIALCLWILTGFGGGNVFSIKEALAPEVVYDKNVWSFSEQIGHVAGCVTGMIVIAAGINPKFTLLIAAGFALITIPVLKYTISKG